MRAGSCKCHCRPEDEFAAIVTEALSNREEDGGRAKVSGSFKGSICSPFACGRSLNIWRSKNQNWPHFGRFFVEVCSR